MRTWRSSAERPKCSAIDSVADTRVIGASTDSARIGLNMASNLGTFMCSHPSTRLPEICQETHSPGQRTCSAYALPRQIQKLPFRILHSRVTRRGIRNALPQTQHLDTARYVAIARNRGFSLARPVSAVSVTASSQTLTD